MKFLGVTILQGVEFPIFPIHFAWALQQQRYCAACDDAERCYVFQSVQYFIRIKNVVLHFVTVKYYLH